MILKLQSQPFKRIYDIKKQDFFFNFSCFPYIYTINNFFKKFKKTNFVVFIDY